MKNQYIISILVGCSLLLSKQQLFSQGCSDAGFCTIDAVKTPIYETDSTPLNYMRNTFKTGIAYGQGQYNIHILTQYLEHSYKIDSNFTATVKLVSTFHSGALTSKFGLSDIIASSSYTASNFTFVGGVKIPLSNGNAQYENNPLPMGYQHSLGTFDMIVGSTFRLEQFSATIAFQQPLIQNNNEFIAEESEIENLGGSFLSTNKYHRSGDMLLRLSYAKYIKQSRFIMSLLPILHLQNDFFFSSSGEKIVHEGSQGLTLNVNAFYKFSLGKLATFELNAGGPAISRSVRPDGLSQFSLGVDYILVF